MAVVCHPGSSTSWGYGTARSTAFVLSLKNRVPLFYSDAEFSLNVPGTTFAGPMHITNFLDAF